jgi:NAD(P)-dependent dehydrogenase (short-subunit alcohol dehydrogenase family)
LISQKKIIYCVLIKTKTKMAANFSNLNRDIIGRNLQIQATEVIDQNRNLKHIKSAQVGSLSVRNDGLIKGSLKIKGDLCVEGTISGGCDCSCDSNGDAVCPLLPQPPIGTPVPLTGQNCVCCYEDEAHNVPCRNVNENKVCYNYEELCADFNSTLVYGNIINPGKLILTPNPAYVVPPCQKACHPAPLPPMPLSLTGKHVLVVGASKGIGKACAERFVTEGADVIGTSRHPLCYPPGDYTYPLKTLDIRETKNVKRFIQELMANTWTNGQIDIVVLCPGIHFVGHLASCTGDELTDLYDFQVAGYQRVVHYALPYMRHSDETRMISMGSVAGELTVSLGGYSMAKRALQAWNDIHQQESMLRKAQGLVTYEPTFTLVEPGFILTSISLYEFYKPDTLSESDPNVRASKYAINFPQCLTAPNPTSVVSETVYRVAVAPQPGVRYISDNDTPLAFPGNPTITQLVQYNNGLSADESINQVSSPFVASLISNVQTFKAALSAAYCPP